MSQGLKVDRVASTVISWRARRIEDPVARLRFLRRTMGDRSWLTLQAHGQTRRWIRLRRGAVLWSVAALLLLPAGHFGIRLSRLSERPPVLVAASTPPAEQPLPPVWLAENQPGFEVWSNGLRIERKFETPNEPRQYHAFPLGREAPGAGIPSTRPAGIVFHTTESHQADFDEENTRRLKFLGEALLRYVKDNRSYHYVVDRFGRVWRVVRESDSANHAGYSVWADDRHTYVNLNRSFLGVSVEAQSRPGEDRRVATPAQVNALRLVTEMLRSKHAIPAINCVTHAQVSVNPSNRRIGYHTDWAAGFPYGGLGLPDNYARPVAALWVFGFTYDAQLAETAGNGYRQGLLLAEEQLRQNATAHGLTPAQWRARLQNRYRGILKELQQQNGPAGPLTAGE
ncbi:MAG: peptidoglycan recognition protein family protein [Bryobacteraceae bacterium]|nr:peptidoglycan recognition protein family protein [Bryobacteraceae bacterium]